MKNMGTKVLQLTALVSLSGALAVAPQLNFRSPGRDTVDKVVGGGYHLHLSDMESYYGSFWMTPKYGQSFRSSSICHCLFGDAVTNVTVPSTSTTSNSCNKSCDDGHCSIAIQGSTVKAGASAISSALLAENFLLPRDFNGSISFSPSVKTFSLDFQFFMALDEWVEGLFFRVYGPFAHTRYNLNFEEATPTAVGGVSYAAGFFDSVEVPANSLLKSFGAYANGNNNIAYTGKTVEYQPLRFAKIGCGSQTANYFANLRFELGYNFLLDQDYHLGMMFEIAAPTGKNPDAEYLFSPNNGSKHWELGGGLTSHYTLWRSEDEEKHFGFALEADINHWFKSKETRTFDLKNKPLSRYMLAEKLQSPAVDLQGGEETPPVVPASQFARVFAPVANISTVRAKVSANVEADIVGMFTFTARGFSWDFGYNFWYRGCEKIDLDGCFTSDLWALKGDASVFGFTASSTATNTAVPLSATQSGATITGGLNKTATVDSTVNANIDAPVPAYTNPATPGVATVLNNLPAGTVAQISTSATPVIISATDLDVDGARTRGMSHKIFTHFNYTWADCEDWVPFVGFGADVEFGSRKHNNDSSCSSSTTSTTSSCSSGSCARCAVSQWAVWLKGGLSFN